MIAIHTDAPSDTIVPITMIQSSVVSAQNTCFMTSWYSPMENVRNHTQIARHALITISILSFLSQSRRSDKAAVALLSVFISFT